MNDVPSSSCLLHDRFTFLNHACDLVLYICSLNTVPPLFPKRVLCCLHQPLCHLSVSGISFFISRQPLAVRALVQCICLLCWLSVVASLFSFKNLHFRCLRRPALYLRLHDGRTFKFIACGILASASTRSIVPSLVIARVCFQSIVSISNNGRRRGCQSFSLHCSVDMDGLRSLHISRPAYWWKSSEVKQRKGLPFRQTTRLESLQLWNGVGFACSFHFDWHFDLV